MKRGFACALLALGLPRLAAACPVCFGAADSTMTAGVNNAIFFLLGCIGLVLTGVVKVLWDMRRRMLGNARRERTFRLIEGGAP